ncbi:hypothetical protein DFJ74DRAFT_771136 [Hyaloraphidium curvatum]|nr:hypothetical protein DFJ74DRAFT_771136 [Hyaloraphidium curvatum]
MPPPRPARPFQARSQAKPLVSQRVAVKAPVRPSPPAAPARPAQTRPAHPAPAPAAPSAPPAGQTTAAAPRFTFQSSLGRTAPAARAPVRKPAAAPHRPPGFRQETASLRAILAEPATTGRPTLLGGAARRATRPAAPPAQLPPPTTVRREAPTTARRTIDKRASIYSGAVRMPKKPKMLFEGGDPSSSQGSDAAPASQASQASQSSQLSQPSHTQHAAPQPMSKLNRAIEGYLGRNAGAPRTPGRGVLDPETPRERQARSARRLGAAVAEMEGGGRVLFEPTVDASEIAAPEPAPDPSAPPPLEPRPTRSLRPRPAPAPLEPRATRSRTRAGDNGPVGGKENSLPLPLAFPPKPAAAEIVGPAPASPEPASKADMDRAEILRRLRELEEEEEALERELREARRVAA